MELMHNRRPWQEKHTGGKGGYVVHARVCLRAWTCLRASVRACVVVMAVAMLMLLLLVECGGAADDGVCVVVYVVVCVMVGSGSGG